MSDNQKSWYIIQMKGGVQLKGGYAIVGVSVM